MLDEAQDHRETGSGAPAPASSPPRSSPLDRIVALAADLFDAPSACLALRAGDGVEFPALFGLAGPPGADWAFPWADGAPFEAHDVAGDARFPGAAGAAGPFRFFAGVPLPAPVGALCVFGPTPRPAAPSRDLARLEGLAALAADVLAAEGARGRAEASAEARAGLLADISHELRTPLSGIVGFTELLKRDGRLEGEALRGVERISEAGHGLLRIVGDALDLSRLEAGAARLLPRPFRPAELLDAAAALVRPEAERKGLRLSLALPPDDGPALGDADRLRQVLLNLLSNAVKFTERGTARASLERGTGSPVPLVYAVEDSGGGIAEDDLARLFRRFARVGGGAQGTGAGLGLAISKSLVEAMGGAIGASSIPDAGSRFTVSLALPAAAPAAPAPPASGAPGDMRGFAILLADDATLNQKLTLQMLEPLGAAIDVVGDGAAALEAAARRDYALVLMDMEMPVMDGLAAARGIRALGGRAGSVPIVALTANAFPEQVERGRAAGMDDHLTKPFGVDALAAAVRRWARR